MRNREDRNDLQAPDTDAQAEPLTVDISDSTPIVQGVSSEEASRLGLKALGSGKTNYKYGLDGPPDPGVLEKFVSPAFKRLGHAPGGMAVNIQAEHFTSLCPITGQPDHATIAISYVPREWCVESKSLKLYLLQFRMFGEFHEGCVDRIAMDLIDLLDPLTMQVEGQFVPRGDIKFWPKVQYKAKTQIVGI